MYNRLENVDAFIVFEVDTSPQINIPL